MDKTTQLERRIEALEKQMKDLQTSSSINDNFDKALQGRGFLKSNNFMYAGRVTCGIAGFSRVPIAGANANSIVLANAGTNSVVSILEQIDNGYQVYLESTFGAVIDFMVFFNKTNFDNRL